MADVVVTRSIEEELQDAYVQSEKTKGRKKKKTQDQILLENLKKGGSIHKQDDDATLLANTYDPDVDPKSNKSNKLMQQQTTSLDNPAFVDSETEGKSNRPNAQRKKKGQAEKDVPASIENENEIIPRRPKSKKADVQAKNESNKAAEKIIDDPPEPMLMAAAVVDTQPQPKVKKKTKANRSQSEERVEVAAAAATAKPVPLNNDLEAAAEPKAPQRKKKTQRKAAKAADVADQVAEAAPAAMAHVENRILQVSVHRTDKLKSDLYILHPVVRVYIVDIETGKCVKKQQKDRCVSSYFETQNENVDFIMPIMTQPFDLKKNQSSMPIWEENILFNESFDYLCQATMNVIIFFEVLDFVSMRTANRQMESQLSENGWYHIAWGFLKLVGMNRQANTGKKVRLQLYMPMHRNTPTSEGQPQVYSWWKNCTQRLPYPSTLYVTLKPIIAPTEVDPVSRSMFPMQREVTQGGFDPTHMTWESGLLATSEGKPIREPSLWSRLPGQQCRIPNTLTLSLNSGRNGCYVLKFSNNGKSLACGCHDKEGYPIYIYEIPSGRLKGELTGHHGIIYYLNWSRSDKGLLSASADGTARVWDVEKMSSTSCKVLPHPSFVYVAKHHPVVSRVVVTGGFDRVIRIWSLVSDDGHAVLMQEMDDHVGFVNALCFDEEGSKMYSADSLGNIFVWNVSVSNEPASQGVKDKWTLSKKIAHKDLVGNTVNAITLHPSGRRLLIHTRNNKLQMLDLRVESIITTYVGALNFRELVRSVVTPCGSFIFAGSEDGQAYVWNTDSGALVSTYSNLGYGRSVGDVDYHPFDHIVAFCSYGPSQQIKVYKFDMKVARQEVMDPFGSESNPEPEATVGTETIPPKVSQTAASDFDVARTTRIQRIMTKLNSVTDYGRSLNASTVRNNGATGSSFFTKSDWLTSNVSGADSLMMSSFGRQPSISISRASGKARVTVEDSLRPSSKPLEEVVALYDYDAQRSDELQLVAGQRIKVLFKDNENWWMAVEDFKYSDSESPERTRSTVHAVRTKSGELKFVSGAEDSEAEDYPRQKKNVRRTARDLAQRRESIERAERGRKTE